MTPLAARQVLGVTPDATPEDIERRFNERQLQLAEQIARALTPRLEAHYRAALGELNEAHATLGGRDGGGPRPSKTAPAAPADGKAGPANASAQVAGSQRGRTPMRVLIGVAVALLLAAGAAWRLKSRSYAAEPRRPALLATTGADRQPTEAAAEPKSQEQEQSEWQDAMTLEEWVAKAREARAHIEATARDYAVKADELLRVSRTSPYKPAIWRAERWAESIRYRSAAKDLAEALRSDAEPWTEIAKFEALVAAGEVDEAAKLRPHIHEVILGASSAVDALWIVLYRLTPLEITSNPAGLTWTIETRYDDDKVLVVSGTTPTKGEQFVGVGKGVLRIKHPGSPDVVVESDSFGLSPWANVDASADFVSAKPR